jgi:HEAT repeat protein
MKECLIHKKRCQDSFRPWKRVLTPFFWLLVTTAHAADLPPAWQAAAAWRAGADVAPLLVIEQEGIASMATPDARAAHAARLATVMTAEGSSPDARQWACLQLRFVGTAAEVPMLADTLARGEEPLADAARQALEAIADPLATAALRESLAKARTPLQAGIVAALGRRRDAAAVPLLVPLVKSADSAVAAAATQSLGHIGDAGALAALRALAESAGHPTPRVFLEPLLRAAESAAKRGDAAVAAAVRKWLAAAEEPPATRQPALATELAADLAAADASTRSPTILRWLASDDSDRRIVACGRLNDLDDAAFARVCAAAASLPQQARLAIVANAGRRRSPEIVPLLAEAAVDPSADVRMAAVESLALVASADTVPTIVSAAIDTDSAVRAAARRVLATLPKGLVGEEAFAAIAKGSASSGELADGLADVGGPLAWKRLAEMAVAGDETAALPAIAGLERLAEPKQESLEQLVAIYAQARDAGRREAIGRVIARVAKRSDAGQHSAMIVLAAIDQADLDKKLMLPLVGRLGGPEPLARIDAALEAGDPAIREAAIEGLCNWPTADVADRLRAIAEESLADPAARQRGRRALRAHVRVISLPSERPAADTLASLKQAMTLAAAGDPEDRAFVLERTAAVVRTMPAVEWIAGYLDAADRSAAEPQAACRALVALAHHRGLRQPNADRFDPILDRVAEVTTDPALADRARRYKAGL